MVLVSPILCRVLVDQYKALGLPSRDAPLAAIASGVVLSVLAQVVVGYPGLGPWVDHVVLGLMVGLGAVGVDASVKRIGGTK